MDLVDAAGRHRPAALAALLAQVGVEGVQGGGIQPAGELAEGGPDGAVDVAAVGGHGGGRDRPDALAPVQPAVQQLGHRPVGAGAVLAGADLGDERASACLASARVATVVLFWRLRPVMGSRPA